MASYEQSKTSKLWSVRFREIDLDTNQERNLRLSGFKTKREAQSAYHDHLTSYEAEKERRRALKEEPEDLSFDQLAELYFRYMRTRSKESTVYDVYKKYLARVKPFFVDYHVKDITPLLLLNFIESLKSYSYNYMMGLYFLVCSILKYGEKYHDTPNVSGKVDKPRRLEPKKEMLFWTPDEFQKFYHSLDDIKLVKDLDHVKYKVFFHLLYETGCRKGEAEALHWSDFDFSKKTVSITKNITRKTQTGAYSVTTPKNESSNRIVTLTQPLCDELLSFYEQQRKIAPVLYAFGGDDPPSTQSIARVFSAAIEKSGVKKIRIHDLRHSCASLLISKGVSIVAVARRLGHSSVQETLNTYAHMLPDDSKLSLEAFCDVAKALKK